MSFSRILVPTDFSTHAGHALGYAQTLAKTFGAHLDVLHVWEKPPIVPEMMLLAAGGPPMAVRDFVRLQAAKDMEILISELRQNGTMAHGLLEEGNAAKMITRVAEREQHDLIVMATHGRSGVERLFIGSTAEKVLRRAPCPVFIVPARADASFGIAPSGSMNLGPMPT